MIASLKCEKCDRIYTLGENARCLTSEKLKQMKVCDDGNSSIPLIVYRPKMFINKDSLVTDEVTITQLGPTRGWECDKCKSVNRWNPVYNNHIKTEKKKWWRFW